MTIKPTITSSKGANTVLSSSEWNTDVIQSDNYVLEVIAGVNADKIPGSAIAPNVALAGAVVSGGLTVSSGGVSVVSGTTGVQALTATSGSFNAGLSVTSGTTGVQALTATSVAATGAVTGNSMTTSAITVNGAFVLTGQTTLISGAVLSNTGSSFVSVPGSPAGVFEITMNGSTIKVPYYT